MTYIIIGRMTYLNFIDIDGVHKDDRVIINNDIHKEAGTLPAGVYTVIRIDHVLQKGIVCYHLVREPEKDVFDKMPPTT